MQNSKRRIALLSILAILLYLVPNMVQDVHRVLGHHEHHITSPKYSDTQIQNQAEKCPICVFEFNVIEKAESFAYFPFLKSESSIFRDKCESQIQNKAFHYYNLRAPPLA
jgi:hypothetical protein